ncbi:MAG: hypothetical protein A3F74_27985 [Betaproteobacteria bacterium RIFCSPLOWO2_12_FULL_62_58]|nr:MAG: hypothetical protein A3F74_27985 [Betaproteobacteria bacterium RIFCSPLOWO2_12_FULL_62_58]
MLRDWKNLPLLGAPLLLDRHLADGRRAIARFHSDSEITLRSTAPCWYRKVYDRQLCTFNDKQLRLWLADAGYDPVFEANHRHRANWSWW